MDEVAERIGDDELDEREIDDIILTEFVKTDKDIIRINKKIETISGLKIDEELTSYSCKELVNKLHSLDIRTLKLLKQMIVRNEATAIKIAQILLQPNEVEQSKQAERFISEDIAVFYLCYAELLTKYHDYDSIGRYLGTTGRPGFVDLLLGIQKQLGL